MLERSEGIVLRLQKYGEDRLIADIYTAARGMMGFVMRIPKSAKKNSRTTLLRPLNILELHYEYRPQQELQHLREMHAAVTFHTLPFEPLKEMEALFLAEFLSHALRHEAANEHLYAYLTNSLQWLDTAQRGVANFHFVFLLHLTRLLGIWPAVEADRNTRQTRARLAAGRTETFDLLDGIMTDIPPLHTHYLDKDESAWMPTLLRMNFHTMHLFRLNHAQRNRLLEVLVTYYRLHIPEIPRMKSLEVLREVLSE